jgi:transcriptional regulator with XRE-family HTH domain
VLTKLRQMRQRLELGIVEAANRAKISPGFLSAIELSKANPSVATLQRLASTYNTTVLEFFDMPRHVRRLIRPDQSRTLKTESGLCIELLSVGTKMFECMIFRVPAKAGSDGAYSHVGEEFIYMLEGELEIWLDECGNATRFVQEIVSGLKAISGTAGSTPRKTKRY